MHCLIDRRLSSCYSFFSTRIFESHEVISFLLKLKSKSFEALQTLFIWISSLPPVIPLPLPSKLLKSFCFISLPTNLPSLSFSPHIIMSLLVDPAGFFSTLGCNQVWIWLLEALVMPPELSHFWHFEAVASLFYGVSVSFELS